MTGYTQYGRKCSLIVDDANGTGIDLSQLKIRFTVRQYELNTPTNLVARIYNLQDNTSKIIREEFKQVVLKAGYENGNYGIIFRGTIKYFRRGRENATDKFLEIYAADSDIALNFALINKSVAAGFTSPYDQVNDVQKAYSEYGVETGFQCEVSRTNLPRGKVYFGTAKDIMRDVCVTNNLVAGVIDGKLQIIAQNSYVPDPPLVVTSKTGMIGFPEQTPEGINVTILLNPNIKVGRRLQIDNDSINQQSSSGGAGVSEEYITPYNQYTGLQFLAKTDSDGIYRVIYAEHVGDTRADDWYTKINCLSMDGSIPPTILQRGLS